MPLQKPSSKDSVRRIQVRFSEKAEADGIVLEKEWIATSDSRTRDWHEELDGVTIPIDEPFENAIGKIMFPGDPSADGANVYNCRCTLVSKVKGFKKVRK